MGSTASREPLVGAVSAGTRMARVPALAPRRRDGDGGGDDCDYTESGHYSSPRPFYSFVAKYWQDRQVGYSGESMSLGNLEEVLQDRLG